MYSFFLFMSNIRRRYMSVYFETDKREKVGKKTKVIYMKKDSRKQYVKHNKKYVTLTSYKKLYVKGGGLENKEENPRYLKYLNKRLRKTKKTLDNNIITRQKLQELRDNNDKKLNNKWINIQKAMDANKTYDSYDMSKPKKQTIRFSAKNIVRPFYKDKEPKQYVNKLRSSKLQIPS